MPKANTNHVSGSKDILSCVVHRKKSEVYHVLYSLSHGGAHYDFGSAPFLVKLSTYIVYHLLRLRYGPWSEFDHKVDHDLSVDNPRQYVVYVEFTKLDGPEAARYVRFV